MAPARDSMLEAFKDAKGKSGSVGGPFAGSGGPSGAGVGGGGGGGGQLRFAPGPNPRFLVVALAALGLVFVVGVLVGRATAPAADGTVRAAERGGAQEADPGRYELGEVDAGEPPAPPAEAAPAEGVNALFDARNKYTIVAISTTKANESIAWENYDHLRAQGLSAFPPFETPNGTLAIVVGAAPKESDLSDAMGRLKGLSGPNGKGRPYESAYTYPIRGLTKAKEGQ